MDRTASAASLLAPIFPRRRTFRRHIRHAYRLRRRARTNARTAAPFFDQPVENAEPVAEIGQDEFIRFWRNPVKVWLQQQLAWSEPHIGEAWEPAEPFEPQHAEQIAETYIGARREGQDFSQTAARIAAESLLPSGELGKLWQQSFQTAAKQIDTAVLNSPKLPPFPYAIPSDGQILKGSLGNLYRCGQVFYAYGKPNAPQRIAFCWNT